MKELTEAQQKEHKQLCTELSDAKEHLGDAITNFNETVRDAWRKVVNAQDELNTTIASCNEYREEILERISEQHDAAEEGSCDAQKYSEWLESWNEELSNSEVDEPDEMDDLDMDTESFENLQMKLEP